MSADSILPDGARPALLRGVRPHFDKVRDTWVLLAPERALALVRVAGSVAALLDEAGIGHRSQLLARAHADQFKSVLAA